MDLHLGIQNLRQKTIRRPASCEGIGIYRQKNAKITILPADSDHGIKFTRKGSGKTIDALVCNADYGGPQHKTTILRKGDEEIYCIEHILATLSGLGITNVLIEYEGHEVPIMDGSAREFVKMLSLAGIIEQDPVRRAYIVKDEIYMEIDGRRAKAYPLRDPTAEKYLSAYVILDFYHKCIGYQGMNIWLNPESFREISDARTFCLKKDLKIDEKTIRKLYEHMLVLGKSTLLNPDGFRYVDMRLRTEPERRYGDEPARHKLLDTIGDLSLLGYPLVANVFMMKPGHFLNHILAKSIYEEAQKENGKVELISLH